jgi:hypothetical protein
MFSIKIASPIAFTIALAINASQASDIVNISPLPEGADNTAALQAVLVPGNEVHATGTFRVDGTLRLPSHVALILNGVMQGKHQKYMITNNGKISGIRMRGGVYRGDGDTGIRLIEFSNTTGSTFSDFVVENTGHTFGFNAGCSGNTCSNLVVRKTAAGRGSLNGLADRGSNNKWTDCSVDGTESDAFIVKCSDSTFTRVKLTNGKTTGFGFYARIDGSNNQGADLHGNRIYDCCVSNCAHAAFSLNAPGNGVGARIHDNFIQGVVSRNTAMVTGSSGGLYFGNKSAGGRVENNTFDLLAFDNTGSGVTINEGCTNNSGSVVVMGNVPWDVHNAVKGNTITAYVPLNAPKPRISGSGVRVVSFDPDNPPANSPYCVLKYSAMKSAGKSVKNSMAKSCHCGLAYNINN